LIIFCTDLFLVEPLATSAVGYNINRMSSFKPRGDPATLKYVIYEQVFREWWWKPIQDWWDDDSDEDPEGRRRRMRFGESSDGDSD
jgi:hypothetical protein